MGKHTVNKIHIYEWLTVIKSHLNMGRDDSVSLSVIAVSKVMENQKTSMKKQRRIKKNQISSWIPVIFYLLKFILQICTKCRIKSRIILMNTDGTK